MLGPARLAAEAALERVRGRLAELGQRDPPIEIQFSVPDRWSRHLFLALCRRYGLAPYRYHRQRRNTIMVRAPKGFIDQVLWPEFSELDRALQIYLHEVTLRVIREEVYSDTSEAREVPGGYAAELILKFQPARRIGDAKPIDAVSRGQIAESAFCQSGSDKFVVRKVFC